jgi:hypothetical protein
VRRNYVDRRRLVYLIEPRRLGQITSWLAGTEVGRAFPTTPGMRAIVPLAIREFVEETSRSQNGTA